MIFVQYEDFYAICLIHLNSTVIISFSIFTNLLLSTTMYKNLTEYVGVSFLARVVSAISLPPPPHPKSTEEMQFLTNSHFKAFFLSW